MACPKTASRVSVHPEKPEMLASAVAPTKRGLQSDRSAGRSPIGRSLRERRAGCAVQADRETVHPHPGFTLRVVGQASHPDFRCTT